MLSLISFSEILTQLNLKPSCLPPVNLCHSHEKLKTSSKNEKNKTKQQQLSILVLVHTATSATASTWGTSNNFSTKEFFGAHIWIRTQNKNMFQHAQSMQEVAPSFLQDIYKHYQFQIILLRLSIGFCSRSPTKNEQIIFNSPLLLTLLRSQLIMCSGSTAFHPTKGPQFISQVWRAFCEALSGKVKLKGSIRR